MLLVERESSKALQLPGEIYSQRALCWKGKGVGSCVHTSEQKIPAELPALPTLLFHFPVDVVIVPPQADFSFSLEIKLVKRKQMLA